MPRATGGPQQPKVALDSAMCAERLSVRRRRQSILSVPNRPCAVQEYHPHRPTAWAAGACEYETNNRENKSFVKAVILVPAGKFGLVPFVIRHFGCSQIKRASDLVTIIKAFLEAGDGLHPCQRFAAKGHHTFG